LVSVDTAHGKRIRELKVYTVIIPYHTPLEDIKRENPSAVILSGGPASFYEEDAPKFLRRSVNLGVPVLGYGYGLYGVVNAFGGERRSNIKEYGEPLSVLTPMSRLLRGLGQKEQVWMSHGTRFVQMPEGFVVTASSDNAEIAAIENNNGNAMAFSFHPEVTIQKWIKGPGKFCF
jgi:GMP synthase (glutamine-hydrolysing)